MEEGNCCKENAICTDDPMQYIDSVETVKLGQKTTCVLITMKNGFEICESASCVDPKNYDHETGTNIAMTKATNRMYEMLGFDLQNQLCAKAKGECCTPDESCKETEGGCVA